MRRTFFWFRIPITPYASPLRGVTGTFGALPLKTDADVTAYLDALQPRSRHRWRPTRRACAARWRAASSLPPRSCGWRCRTPRVRAPAGDESRSGRAAPPRLAASPRGAFCERIDTAITDVVNPSVERLAAFVDGPYRAKAPASVGLVAVSRRARLLPVPDPDAHVAGADA
jgi:uncharacterized protein (DUF885 family)